MGILTLDVDLSGRALDDVADLVVLCHADKAAAVEHPVDPGDDEVAAALVPPRARGQGLIVDLPGVLDRALGLGLAPELGRLALDHRVIFRADRKEDLPLLQRARPTASCNKKASARLFLLLSCTILRS